MQNIYYIQRMNNLRQKYPLLDLLLILKRLFSQPSIIGITGEWKSGKTDLGFWIGVDICLDKLKIVSKVASNVKTFKARGSEKPDPRVEYIADLENLRYWLHKDREKKLYIFDEAVKLAYKRTPMNRTQVGLIQIITELSKGHARGIVIGQDLTMIDKDLMNPIFCKAVIIKKGFFHKDKILLASHLISGGSREFSGIPKTSVLFDPYLEADFDESSQSVFFSNPEVNIFYKWINGESMIKLKKEILQNRELKESLGYKHIDSTTVRRIIKRVGKALLSVNHLKPEEVEVAISHLKAEEVESELSKDLKT